MITVAEFDAMSADEQRADIARWHALFAAVGCNINLLDPNDPAHARAKQEQAEDTYDQPASLTL